ncbi:MAG: M28 family peptidase [Gemmatimonadales bacterium]|nr:M28 family peptidase [Gemmatimonadales bacterium]
MPRGFESMGSRHVLMATVATLVAFPCGLAGQEPQRLMGFTSERAAEQLRWERVMAAVPDTATMREYHFAMTRAPHHAGTEENYRLATYLRDIWDGFGFETEMVRYDILVPWPVDLSLRLVYPETIELAVTEPPIPEDPDSYVEGGLPGMAAYVASGRAEGDVIYANYGRIGDYRHLDDLGVSLEGKIVLVRYGGTPGQMRGMKVREAAKRGAVGVVIYSDPEDDGYVRGDIYPEGRWRPWEGIQRGSFLDVPIYPGDPLTPFEPSIPGVERIAFEDAENVQKIPVQPISYGEALKILEHVGGDLVPAEWQGGLPLAYHMGPGPARIEIDVEYDYQERPVWNVFGKVVGSVEPEKFVLAGGHRDSWVLGARDPTSGAVSLLETARGVAAAVAEGFQPRRSIVFGSWGGEDFFLLGSTEWGEQFADELKENMVVYINRESYTSGDWSAAGNHSLERFMIETSKDAPHPEAATLFDAWQGQQPGEALRLGALGSGSDYTVFLDHLGVPSLNVGYGSANGIYHSLYDTYYYYQRFGDPGYKYGVAQADMVGRMVMRLANADILPFDFTSASGVIAGYVDELVAMDEGGLLRDELREIGAANAAMRVAATETNGVLARLLGGAAASAEQNRSAVDQVNALIMRAEREMIDERGLWRRPWYRNLIYAPGYYEGYAAKTLPGVREPMEDGAWEVARTQAGMLVEALERVTLALTEAGTVARAATTRVIS